MPKVKEPVVVWNVNTEEIDRLGQEIFRRVGPTLEAEHTGRYIAIEPYSGEFFIADRGIEAILAGRAKHPGRVFFLGRIGFRTAVTHKGMLSS